MFVRIANVLALVLMFSSSFLSLFDVSAWGETLGEYWDTAEEESKYYRIVEIPMPAGMAKTTARQRTINVLSIKEV